jgi:hypothetical protein
MVKGGLRFEILAALPALAAALLVRDFPGALRRADPLVVFRVLLLAWVVGHVWLNVGHLVEDLRSIRSFLSELADVDPRLARAGDRAFCWSGARVFRLAFRHAWFPLLLAALVVAVNATAWHLLAG